MSNTIKPGMIFGRWSVISRAADCLTKTGAKIAVWHCRCTCNVERDVRAGHLRTRRSQSCGCFRSESASLQMTTHGESRSALYSVWLAMHQRCYNPRNRSFHRYGQRGILVCDRWHAFAEFLADSSDYRRGLTIDRRDNDGPYAPENCRWVTNKANSRNTSRTVKAMFEGREESIADLADRFGLKLATVYRRFCTRGESIDRALRPVIKPKKELSK